MAVSLDAEARRALEVKEVYRDEVSVPVGALQQPVARMERLEILGPDYDDVPVGRYFGLENIRLRWVKPDWFEFVPRRHGPFGFERATGERITPRRMFTDGGTIPRILWFSESLSPWGYVPAFLVHDWEFDLHHCGRGEKSFEAVRDTMVEGIKTLMEAGLCPKSLLTFKAIFAGIDSVVARAIWDRNHIGCPLPPDADEEVG